MNRLNYVGTPDGFKTTYIPFNSDERYAASLAANAKATLTIPSGANVFYVSAQGQVHVGFEDFTPNGSHAFTPVNYITDQVGVVIPSDARMLTIVNGGQAQHIAIYFYQV